MIPQIFTVLTEFRFEVGSAVLQTDALTGAVNRLSGSADQALASMQYASAGIVGSFTNGAGGGILGVLYSAVQAADKFNSSQISLANTLSAPGQTFAESMERASMAMENIGKVAKQFSLPADELLNITKLLGPMMSVHGMAGSNYSSAVNLGRRFLKSAPMLGVDSSMATGQLQRTMGGQASMGDTLFQRLTGETKAMQPFMGNTKAFNAMDFKQRMQILNAALDQFAGNTKAVTAQAHTLNGEIMRLKTNLYGAFSVLRDLGQVILKPVLQVINAVNKYLETNGKKISENIGRMLSPWISDAHGFIATLMQIRDLKKDIASGSSLLGVIAGFVALQHILKFIGVEFSIITPLLALFRYALMGLGTLFAGMTFTGFVTGLYAVLNGITVFVSSILAPLVLLVGLFQLLSRALAYAKMNALEHIANMMPKISEAFANFSGLMGIFMEGFDTIARGLGVILDPTKFLGFIDLVSVAIGSLSFLTEWLTKAVMGFEGLALAIMEFFSQIKNFLMGQGFDKNAISNAFEFGMQDVYDKVYGKVAGPEAGGTANQVVNMDVKMENHFKEMMEPDRVAFTIKDQLLKASQNKTTAARQGFAIPATGR